MSAYNYSEIVREKATRRRQITIVTIVVTLSLAVVFGSLYLTRDNPKNLQILAITWSIMYILHRVMNPRR